MQSQTAWSVLESIPASKSALEIQSTNIVQSNDVGQEAMQGPAEEGENALEGSREEIPSLELAEQITICRPIPVMEPNLSPVNTSLSSLPASAQQLQHKMEDIGSEHSDIIQDAQFFQDTAIEYQATYHSLEDRYTHQDVLMKEASEALQASESQVSAMQQELLALKHNREADIERAVSNMILQYQQQLSSAQSRTRDHQSAIMQLRDQVQTLQLSLSLASWGDLPPVGTSQGEADLREEVFNFVQGTININRGTAVYHSPD